MIRPTEEELSVVKKIKKDMDKSPYTFQVIENNKKQLLDSGFIELQENGKWNLKRGSKYFFTKNQTAIFAFAIPKGDIDSFMIVTSHSDYPTLKIKHNPSKTINNRIQVLSTESYSCPMFYSYVDTPLSVAGRLITKCNGKIVSNLVNANRPLVLIPNLCSHMYDDVNRDGIKFDPYSAMRPLYGDNEAESIIELLANEHDINYKDVIDYDLYLYNCTKASIWGAHNEFYSARALDNQISVYSSLYAIKQASPANSIPVHVVFDNEEVGSKTKQGAQSKFFDYTLEKICMSLGMDHENYINILPTSLILSADNGHGYHPNFNEYNNDATQGNMGEGVLLKFSSSFSYGTDGITASIVKTIANKNNAKIQDFYNKTGVSVGSTLSKHVSPRTNIMTADVGLSQLAMHSSYETCASKDLLSYIKLLKSHYESSIIMEKDGTYIVK